MKLSPEQRAEWVAALDAVLARTPVPIKSREPSSPKAGSSRVPHKNDGCVWSPSTAREWARARLCALMTDPEPVMHSPGEKRIRQQNVDHGIAGLRSLLADERAFDSAESLKEALEARGLQ